MVEIYCDGSAKANGTKDNAAGFGVCALVPDERSWTGSRIDYLYNKQFIGATNNQMELKALIKALYLARSKYINDLCIIKSDSAYCVNIFNDWIYKWHANGWKRPGNKEIENLDLIKELWDYCTLDFQNFRVDKVPGHSGIVGNEIADALSVNDEEKIKEFLEKYGCGHIYVQKIDS